MTPDDDLSKDARGVAAAYPLFRLANRLYRRCPSLYLPVYEVYKRVSDRAELRLMRASIRPGMRCADVGANVGFTTRVMAALAGPAGKVYAFEPSPENFDILGRRRLGANVQLFQAALGATSGEITLYVSDDMNVDHRTYPTENARRQVRVPQATLDEAVPDGALDFVKMDVQGYELNVLAGMKRLLESRRPLTMIVEFWPWGIRRAGGKPDDLPAILRSAGFSLSMVSGERVEDWVESPTWYRNLLAVRG